MSYFEFGDVVEGYGYENDRFFGHGVRTLKNKWPKLEKAKYKLEIRITMFTFEIKRESLYKERIRVNYLENSIRFKKSKGIFRKRRRCQN